MAFPPRPSINQLLDFSGHTVLVTGARKGLGQGIALRFAEAGAAVIVHTRQPEEGHETCEMILNMGQRCHPLAADLRDEAAVADSLKRAEATVGSVRMLVNNAGVYPVETITSLMPARFDAIVQANLGTAYRVTKLCADRWRERAQHGVIVNISSIESTRPAVGHSHYASAKAALDMLTRATAVELAPDIRVNAVAPGLVYTPELADTWPEGVKRYRERALLGREGHRTEVADVCLFLCSPAASWMTGEVVVVDGGVSAAPHF